MKENNNFKYVEDIFRHTRKSISLIAEAIKGLSNAV